MMRDFIQFQYNKSLRDMTNDKIQSCCLKHLEFTANATARSNHVVLCSLPFDKKSGDLNVSTNFFKTFHEYYFALKQLKTKEFGKNTNV